MTCHIEISAKAKEDFINIWLYSLQAWGDVQADSYLDEINQRLSWLADNPKLGKPRSDVRAGYYSFAVNRHVVFYTLAEKVLHIQRILHVQMDAEQHI